MKSRYFTIAMLRYVATASAYSKAFSASQPSSIFSASIFFPTSRMSFVIFISVRTWRGLNKLYHLKNP